MIQIFLALIVIFVIIALGAKLLKFASNLFLGALGLLLIAACGIQIAAAYSLERIGILLHARQVLSWLIAISSITLSIFWGFFNSHEYFESLSFSSLKFLLSGLLFLVIAFKSNSFKYIKKICTPIVFIENKESQYYFICFSAFAISLSSSYSYLAFQHFNWNLDYLIYIEITFWVAAILAQIYIIGFSAEMIDIATRFKEKIKNIDSLQYRKLKKLVSSDASILENNEIDILIQGMLAKLIFDGVIKEVEIEDEFWIFDISLYESAYEDLKIAFAHHSRLSEEDAIRIVVNYFPFTNIEASYYIEKNIEWGQYYNFFDGKYFCVFENRHKIRTCICCGITETTAHNDTEWICSDICSETEKICYEIKKQPYEKFIADAATSGFVIMAGAQAWNSSHRRVSPKSNTAHGNAAEKANHMIDRITGKDSKLLGDNNIKNGADRLVNGELSQSKYCGTGARSVGAAFDNKGDGNYRYMADNRPMPLEVPKDQYDNAVKTMANKIKEGKVPGVSNPDEAKNLVRAGSLTYEQAVNITKFGTIESVVYDMAEGAIISFSAAGISFGITAAIYYINTKDKSEALRVAALQAGKAFSTTLIVYVGAQQLHRLNSIVNLLDAVDVKHLPPSLKKILGDGLGVSSTAGINKALHGSIVTSVVIITLTSGPDLLKMIRGKISGAQFIQNLSVVSSGVAGGTIGSIAGGVLCSPLGPAGMIAGRVVGGIAGGMLSSLIATNIAGKLREDDRTQMMKIIKVQFEYLAMTFMMTKDEIDNVNRNLEKVITQETLEKMYAAKGNKHAFATFCLKPVFVGVIKQRKAISFDEYEIVDALKQMAA